jgi:fucose permease
VIQKRHRRAWVLIAAIAIVAVLLLMLAPHGPAGYADVWFAVLSIWFIGVIFPFRLSHSLECFNLHCTTDALASQPSFQRPPSFRLA